MRISLSVPAPSMICSAADVAAPEEATPEEELSDLLQAQLVLGNAGDEVDHVQSADTPELPAMEQLLKLCGQEVRPTTLCPC